jgi:hypothetical protein
MRGSRTRLSPSLAFGIVVVAALPLSAQAQAWVAPKGEGSVTIAAQVMKVENHLSGTTEVAVGEIDTVAFIVDSTFSVTDKLSVDLAVPYITSRYVGPVPHPGSNRDNGNYHGTLADLRFAVRYNLTRRGVVFTPYVGTTMPSTDYVFLAHSAPGPRLKELQFGAYAAKLFDAGIPNVFLSGRYSFGITEKVLEFRPNRSTADLEVGYFLSPRLRAFAMASGQFAHDGIDFPLGGTPALPSAYRPVHDQIQKVHFVKVGAGAAFGVTDGFDVFGSFARQVTGRNGHALDYGITIGASWGFSLGRSRPEVEAAARSPRPVKGATARKEGSLLRCICQKG